MGVAEECNVDVLELIRGDVTGVDQGDDDVSLAGLFELLCHSVGGFNRVIPRDARDTVRAYQVRHISGDGADEGDLHAIELFDRVRLGALDRLSIGGQVGELRVGDDAVRQVRSTLVELVVTHSGDLQAHGVEDVDRRGVVKQHCFERARADVVAGRGEDVSVTEWLRFLVDRAL